MFGVKGVSEKVQNARCNFSVFWGSFFCENASCCPNKGLVFHAFSGFTKVKQILYATFVFRKISGGKHYIVCTLASNMISCNMLNVLTFELIVFGERVDMFS